MDEVAPEPEHVAQTAGQKLHSARVEKGKALADYAASLKIAEPMLDALERDALDELPPGPYATGFARSYARALGLDDKAIVAEIRAMQRQEGSHVTPAYVAYEPVEAARVPTRLLAWTAAGIALAMVVAYAIWKSVMMQPDVTEPAPAAAAPAAPAPAPTTAGPGVTPSVVTAPKPPETAMIRIAASSQVWFSLEDEAGRSQFDLTLQGGEYYTLRPNQRGLRLRTGRPQSLRILIDDQRLPQLGPDDAVISGVVLDPASLSQRLRGGATADSSPAATNVPAAPTVAPPVRR